MMITFSLFKKISKSCFHIILIALFITVSLNTPPADVISPVARAISECDRYAVNKGSILTDNRFCEPCEGPGDAPASLTLREKLALLVFARANTVDEIKEASSSKVGGIFVRPSDRNDEATYNGISDSLDGSQPLVAVDYEGGRVQAPGPGITGALQSARELGTKTDAQIKDIAKNKGAKLKSYGINMDFAPVLDIGGTNNAVIGDRAFANDAATVSSKAEAFTEGLRESGVISTIKHFPGHGSTEGNSHDQPVRTRSLADLEARDIKPFKKLSKNPKTAIMTGHLIVPEWGSQATSLNPKTYEYIRGELSFDGVVVTDALDMEGITNPGDQPSRALVAIQAGADMALLTSTGQIGPTLDKLEQAVTAGELTEERVDESVGRINTLRGVDTSTPSAGSPTNISTGSVRDLAQQMLANGNITYWDNGVDTRGVVVALSEGRKAYTTSPDPVAVANREVDINPNILSFILEAAKTGPIMVNALTDKDHSSNSNHYSGKAVDLQNSGPTTQPVAVYDTAAQKFGGVRNDETTHWHYDFTSDAAILPVDNPSVDNTSCCSGTGGTGTLTGANNEEKIYNYLSAGQGIGPIQAAGIMGNMKAESSYSPIAKEAGGTGVGLVQWSFGRGDAVVAAASAVGINLLADDNDENLKFQLDYMINESKGRTKRDDPGTEEWAGLANTTRVDTFDVEVGSTIYWEYNFERPASPGQQPRIDTALDVMTRLGGGAGTVSQVSATTPGTCPGGSTSAVCEVDGAIPIPDGIDPTFFNAHDHHQSVSYPGGSDRHRPLLGNFGAYGTESVTQNGAGTGEAVDVGAPPSTAVLAPFSGTVTYSAGVSGRGDSDKAVVVESENKKCAATLAHMQPTVAEGDAVTAGQEIGVLTNMGSTSHLHFELWVDGEPINIGLDSDPCGLGEDPCDNFADEAEQIWNKQKETLTGSNTGASDVISL